MDFEKLLHDFEFENQEYVRQIEKEKQIIEGLESEVSSLQTDLQRENELSPQLDEDTKRFHKQFTNNRDNVESIQRTLKLLASHEEVLSAQLKTLTQKGEEEKKQHQDVIEHYESIWSDYKQTYENFPEAKKLQSLLAEKETVAKKHKETNDRVDELTKQLEDLQLAQERRRPPFPTFKDFVVKIAEIKLNTIAMEKQIIQDKSECLQLEQHINNLKNAIKLKQEAEKKEREEKLRREEQLRKEQMRKEELLKKEEQLRKEQMRKEELLKKEEQLRKEQLRKEEENRVKEKVRIQEERKAQQELYHKQKERACASSGLVTQQGAVSSHKPRTSQLNYHQPSVSMPPPLHLPLVMPQSRMASCLTPKQKSPPKVALKPPTTPGTPLLSVPTRVPVSQKQPAAASVSPKAAMFSVPQMNVDTAARPLGHEASNVLHSKPRSQVQGAKFSEGKTSTVSMDLNSNAFSLHQSAPNSGEPEGKHQESEKQVPDIPKSQYNITDVSTPTRPQTTLCEGNSPFDLEKQLNKLREISTSKSPSAGFLFQGRPMFNASESPKQQTQNALNCQIVDPCSGTFGPGGTFASLHGAGDGHTATPKLEGISALTDVDAGGDAQPQQPTFNFTSPSDNPPSSGHPFSFCADNQASDSPPVAFSFGNDTSTEKEASNGLFSMFGGSDNTNSNDETASSFSFSFGNSSDSTAPSTSSFSLF